MAAIQQLYCTHCTYGSSVLEQREGEIANRVLGYSARAASLDGAQLRHDFREIERFLYYYLPADTPQDDKQRLDAATAPRRLFFYPSSGTLQIVGQVCYRKQDTAGRLGSYFAHVLFAPGPRPPQPRRPSPPSSTRNKPGNSQTNHGPVAPESPPEADAGQQTAVWPVVDCLRLWGAPWVEEDSEALSKRLYALGSLTELWGSAPPVINDGLLLRFLTAAKGEPIDPSGRVVSERWSDVETEKRRLLLVDTLKGFLSLGPQSRENVILVAEPGVAALIFYGVARLLPQSLTASLSFSTFEPNVERASASLVATTFHAPETSDIRPEFYRRRGLVINTYTGRVSEGAPPRGEYADFIVERLLGDGATAVDRLVTSFHEAGAKTAEDLELLKKSVGVVDQLLSRTPAVDESWRGSTAATRYIVEGVRQRLSGVEPGAGLLEQIAGSAHHLAVLEMIAPADPLPASLLPAAKYLVSSYPVADFRNVLLSTKVSRQLKVDSLVKKIKQSGSMPPGCDALFGPATRGASQAGGDEDLLVETLVRLPDDALQRWFFSIEGSARPQLLPCLFNACLRQPPTAPLIKSFIVDTLLSLPGVTFVNALLTYQVPLEKCLPRPPRDRETQALIAELAKPLDLLVRELPAHPQQFSNTIDLLSRCFENNKNGYFSDPAAVQTRLGHWKELRKQLLALREVAPKGAWGRVASLVGQDGKAGAQGDAEKKLAKAMLAAMPQPHQFNDPAAYADDTAELKIKVLNGLARSLLGQPLPKVIDWSLVERYIKNPTEMYDRIPRSGASGKQKSGKKPQGPGNYGKLLLLLGVGILLGTSAAILGGKLWIGSGEQRVARVPATDPAKQGTGQGVGKRPMSAAAANGVNPPTPAAANKQVGGPATTETDAAAHHSSPAEDPIAPGRQTPADAIATAPEPTQTAPVNSPVSTSSSEPTKMTEKGDNGPALPADVNGTDEDAANSGDPRPQSRVLTALKDDEFAMPSEAVVVSEYVDLRPKEENAEPILLATLANSTTTVAIGCLGLSSPRGKALKLVNGSDPSTVDLSLATGDNAESRVVASIVAKPLEGKGSEISFVWHESVDRAVFDSLARCVVQIGQGDGIQFVALHEPIRKGPLEFDSTSGAALLGVGDNESTLVAGKGIVQLESAKTKPASDAPPPMTDNGTIPPVANFDAAFDGKPTAITSLPNNFESSGAKIALRKEAGKWLLFIRGPFDFAQKDDKTCQDALKTDKGRIDAIAALLKQKAGPDQVITGIDDLWGMLGARPPDHPEWESKAGEPPRKPDLTVKLAELLDHIKKRLPPRQSAQPTKSNTSGLSVDGCLKPLLSHLQQLRGLRTRGARSVSTIVYRPASPNIYVEYARFGSPEEGAQQNGTTPTDVVEKTKKP